MNSVRLIPQGQPKPLLNHMEFARLQELQREVAEIVQRGQQRAQEKLEQSSEERGYGLV